MHEHYADAIKAPQLIHLAENLYLARFESMKVWSTVAAVEQLLTEDVIARGDTLLDSSSGIYAYALALACHKFGLHCHIVASKTVDRTLMLQLQILGATVEQAQPMATLKLDQSFRVARIQALLAENPRMHWMQQYHDDVHYLGYAPVAEQIRSEFDAEPLTLVGGVGSGCSTGGIAQALRASGMDTALIGVQPFGSMSFGAEHVEDPGIIIAGIGSSIPFRNVRHALYDEMHWVSFDHGLAATVALLRRHGVFAGLSSGCGYLVARREAARDRGRRVLLLAADTGHRYVDAVYAHHAAAGDIDTFAPAYVDSLEALALPWAALRWAGREHPRAQAQGWPPARPLRCPLPDHGGLAARA